MADYPFSADLPESDPCYSTLKAYKTYIGAHLDAFAQAFQYQQYGARLEQWRQCCPQLSAEADRLRPEQPDPEPLRTIKLPADLFNPRGACAQHLYFKGSAAGESHGKAWFEYYHAFYHEIWDDRYKKLSEQLHACCVKHFDDCLTHAPYGRPAGTSEAAVLEACVRQFSPEHQPPVAVPGAPASSATAVAQAQVLEQQYARCQQERSECQEQAAQTKKEHSECQEHLKAEQLALQERVRQGEGLGQDLAACQATAAGLHSEVAGLQQALSQHAAHPGAAALAAFPEGPGSFGLALLGLGTLAAGLLIGRSGWQRRLARWAGGLFGGLFSLLIGGLVVVLLPDTAWPGLLLAWIVAVLLALLAYVFRLRRRSRKTPLPEDEIDLDAAEKALAGRR